MDIDRRCFVGAVATARLSPVASLARASPQAPERLAELAARSGRFYGAAVRLEQLAAEPDLRAAVLHHCHALSPEISLHWSALSPARGVLQFAALDDLASFALSHGLRLRGHALLWHGAAPEWAAALLRDTQDWRLIKRHFGSVMPRYGDVVDEWIVVNEPIDTGHRYDGLRTNVFLEAFGPEYIRRALDEARLFAPRAVLAINEYGLEYANQVETDRRYLFLKLLENLKRSGAPLDDVGLQAHLDLSKGPLAERAIETLLSDIAALGFSITITELDVKEADTGRPTADRDRDVASAARHYLDIALAQPAVRGVVTWGISDRHSWLSDESQGAADRAARERLNRGLPLDAEMRPTPLLRTLAEAFNPRARA